MDELHGTRVLLIDDCPLLRAGLRCAVESTGMSVVGETADARSALLLARDERADVAVLDVASSAYDGVALVRELVACTRAKVLVLSAFPARAKEAFEAGAHAFALKTDPVDAVVQAARSVAQGVRSASVPADPLQHLTPREREVFVMVLEGMSTERISVALSIAMKTVESHRASLNRKLGVHSSADIVRFAAAHGLLAPRVRDARERLRPVELRNGTF